MIDPNITHCPCCKNILKNDFGPYETLIKSCTKCRYDFNLHIIMDKKQYLHLFKINFYFHELDIRFIFNIDDRIITYWTNWVRRESRLKCKNLSWFEPDFSDVKALQQKLKVYLTFS